MVIFAVTMLIALSSKIPTSIALMAGVAGMLVSGVLKMDEAYSAINWKTVFLMACLIPLGWAMDSSGAAAWVAGHSIERLPEGLPVWVIQLAMALLTTLFSLVISHVGATIGMVQIGRAHVRTPGTHAHPVCRLSLEKQKQADQHHDWPRSMCGGN